MFRIDLDELRKLADKQEWMVEKEFLLAVAKELGELRDRLEAAERGRDEVVQQLVQSEAGKRKVSEENDALRDKIAEMEKQEPVAYLPLSNARILENSDLASVVVWSCPDKAASDMPLYTLPGAQPAPGVPDDVIEQAVNRFLSWKLPKDFHPDGGMVFIPTKQRGYDSPHWPVGTNLLTADQAREMLRYVLAAAPESEL